ncbi:MAG: PQQ-binding-like beta-propeller repeat protein [Coriobacteriia bacterium]|nr:PQQ-binding-like beta-propeller repeat protein [Coriobacteriia bacterium]
MHVRSNISLRLALVLAIFAFSLLVMVPVAWAQEVTATLRVEFIEDTRLAPMEVTMEHRPLSDFGINMSDPGFVTPIHLLAEGLEQRYGAGSAASMINAPGMLMTIDDSFGSIAGEPNVWWMFAINQSMPVSTDTGWGYASNQYRVQNGDDIDFLGMWGGQWGVASPFIGFFGSQTYHTTVGQPLEVELLGLDGFDDFAVRPSRILEGAEILVDPAGSTRAGATTASGTFIDEEGLAELTFDEAGTFLLSARRPIASPSSPSGTVSDITRPFAVVTVSESSGQPNWTQEGAPAASIDFSIEELTNLVPGVEYSIDSTGSTDSARIVANADGTIPLSEAWFGQGIDIVRLGIAANHTLDSDPQNLAVPSRSSAPTGLGSIDATGTVESATGVITGVGSAMEWRLRTGTTWTAVSGATVENLIPGTYYVRFQSEPGSFASASAAVIVSLDQQYWSQASTPTAAVDFELEVLTGLTPEAAYLIAGQHNMSDSSGAILLDAAWLGQNISIVKLGNPANFTLDSDVQSLAVPLRPHAPTGLSPANATDTNSDGSIAGVAFTMEWRLSTSHAWTAVTGATIENLVAGTYHVRFRATSGSFASAYATVTVSVTGELPSVRWSSFRGNAFNLARVDSGTPATNQLGRTLWSQPVSDGSSALSPVKVGDAVYIAGGSTLWKLDSAGSIVDTVPLEAPIGQAAFLAAGSGKIFVPIGAGQVQAFDAHTLQPLWTSEPFASNWQALGALTYKDGYLYGSASFDLFMRHSEGAFFCLDASTGEEVWTHSSSSGAAQTGFYWAGAAVTDHVVLFAGDEGILVSHTAGTQTARATGIVDTAVLAGGVRSPVLFVENEVSADGSGVAFASTRDGFVSRVVVAADGSLGPVLSAPLSGEISTATPVIYRNRLYVVSGELLDGGYVDVFSATTLERLRSIELPGFSQSSPLLATAGSNSANGYEVSLFVALNDMQDDVVRIIDSERVGAEMRAETFLSPGGSFALNSVSACDQGRLYYVDGRGNFTAITAANQQLSPGNGGNGNNGNDNNNNGDAGGGTDGSGNNGGANDDIYSPQEEDETTSEESGSEDATGIPGDGSRAAGEGPKTADVSDAMRWLFFAALALTAGFAVIAAKIADRKKEKLKKLEKFKEDASQHEDSKATVATTPVAAGQAEHSEGADLQSPYQNKQEQRV